MAAEVSKQYIIIYLNNIPHAIEIKYIESIIVMQNITRIPKAQSYFKGVINLRGDVVPVMSLRLRLKMDECDYTNSTRIIILKLEEHGAPVGVIVDAVKEVISLDDSDIEKLSYDETEEKASNSLGIGKYKDELISILNVPSIIGGEKKND
ncbi:MAG TPA: chemotaxis protein CheW [Clostridiales bacterium]|nr:chemotaxis protein CheW [Clostridiales bacterium]